MDFPKIKGWDFGPWLTGATADYYLLVDTYLTLEVDGSPDATAAEAGWQTHSAEMAEEIAKYLIMACAGEMRHSPLLHAKPPMNRHQVWDKAFKHLEGASNNWLSLVTAGWAEQFADPKQFQGSVGGKLWGQAASLTSQYLSSELTPVMFVEFALNLHHNCARIFNKLPLPSGFMLVLDAGFAGIADDENHPKRTARIVLAHASAARRDQWLAVHKTTNAKLQKLAGKDTPPTAPAPTAYTAPSSSTKKALPGGGSANYQPSSPEKLW